MKYLSLAISSLYFYVKYCKIISLHFFDHDPKTIPWFLQDLLGAITPSPTEAAYGSKTFFNFCDFVIFITSWQSNLFWRELFNWRYSKVRYSWKKLKWDPKLYPQHSWHEPPGFAWRSSGHQWRCLEGCKIGAPELGNHVLLVAASAIEEVHGLRRLKWYQWYIIFQS